MYSLRKETLSPVRNSSISSSLKSPRNMLYDIPLGRDIDANGISDGWISLIDAGNTATLSIDDGAQKVTIVATTNAVLTEVRTNDFINVAVGSILNLKVDTKITGNVKSRIKINWYNSSNIFISSSLSTLVAPVNLTTITLNTVAPATTAKFRVIFDTAQNNAGDIGAAWFKDAKLYIKR